MMNVKEGHWAMNGEELPILAKRTFIEVGKKISKRKYQKALVSMFGGIMALEARDPESPLLKEGIVGSIIRVKNHLEQGTPFTVEDIHDFNVLLDTWVKMPRWAKLLGWFMGW